MIEKEPEAILNRWMVKQRNHAEAQLPIKCRNVGIFEASWEDATMLHTKFPKFDLWGSMYLEEGVFGS